MLQTRRHALCVADTATLAKLFAGFLQSCQESLTSPMEEHQILERFSEFLIKEAPLCFKPRMAHDVVQNDKVDVDTLPANAKRIRKRPASAMA